MSKYVKAVECADIISEKLNIPRGDLVDVFAEIPAADVAPRSDIAREIFEEIEHETKNHGITYTMRKIAELKKKYTEG